MHTTQDLNPGQKGKSRPRKTAPPCVNAWRYFRRKKSAGGRSPDQYMSAPSIMNVIKVAHGVHSHHCNTWTRVPSTGSMTVSIGKNAIKESVRKAMNCTIRPPMKISLSSSSFFRRRLGPSFGSRIPPMSGRTRDANDTAMRDAASTAPLRSGPSSWTMFSDGTTAYTVATSATYVPNAAAAKVRKWAYMVVMAQLCAFNPETVAWPRR
mmetsp:Transcript_6444/g.14228  ORF Transcript_6444/g.14228 Transcript_6444/m.14228 type:complete len:209 (-) Transcript_6444:428-1054(-)